MSEDEKLQFIYTFEPTRPELVTDPGAWTEDEIATARAHFAYLQQGSEEGTVILAGRSQDGVGPAIVILEAASEAEARNFMQNDPFVASGLMRASLHPYRVALMRRS